jgi:Uma2 family endonuclease
MEDSEHLPQVSTALRMPPRMTVAEFLEWEPDDRSGALWQLRDGEPEMMAPASERHGSIQAQLAYLIISHLDARGSPCRVVTAPGVVPSERSEDNCLVPDLGITCAPPAGEHLMVEPLVLIEILSPTNVSRTRSNIRAYTTIPEVDDTGGEGDSGAAFGRHRGGGPQTRTRRRLAAGTRGGRRGW